MIKKKILFLTITSGLWAVMAWANLDQYKEHSVVVLSKDSQGKVYVGSAPVGSTVTISQLHEECPDYFIASDCECTVSSSEQIKGLYEIQVTTLPESYVYFTLQMNADVQILKVMIVRNNIFAQSFFNVTTVAQFDAVDELIDDLSFLLEEGTRTQEDFSSVTQIEQEITLMRKMTYAGSLLAATCQKQLQHSLKISSDWMSVVMQWLHDITQQ